MPTFSTANGDNAQKRHRVDPATASTSAEASAPKTRTQRPPPEDLEEGEILDDEDSESEAQPDLLTLDSSSAPAVPSPSPPESVADEVVRQMLARPGCTRDNALQSVLSVLRAVHFMFYGEQRALQGDTATTE